jgi:arylsulfatase A-like enzyme
MKLSYTILFSSLLISYLGANTRPAKPNVVLILTDDLGWQDVKCYDIDEPSPMETPNIDALAKKGVMFWQAYSPAPTCAPSRCAIMSGTHPARAQKTHVVGGAPPTPNHKIAWSMIAPWYSGRMPANEMTLARALRANGYTTGHSGKWHMAIDHNAFPQPEDQGFDWTRSSRGARSGMSPSRVKQFATNQKKDPFRLDKNGFPFHQTSEDALTFLEENHAKPFFLYYATWLVHTPIHTRSEKLLEKYCKKLGVEKPTESKKWTEKGQRNPFYCAMVEELDYYLGKVFNYLAHTDDPRWPGHKLQENTYLIFTSDNGGMEASGAEVITDNYPLDKGKISAMEGGTRVPLIMTGPGIKANVKSDVMVNGLDFYPTLMSLTGTQKPKGKNFDGADLSSLLLKDATDASLVRDSKEKTRDTMVWHFPNSVAFESTIRIGDYKLVRNYNHQYHQKTPEFELYHLYQTEGRTQTRVDIEEAKNLVPHDPERTKDMNNRLTQVLTEMNASYPYFNRHCRLIGAEKKLVPEIVSHQRNGRVAVFNYKEKGAQLIRADLIYSKNGHDRYEEWFRAPAQLDGNGSISAVIPSKTTHYFINLIDENNFLVSYPEHPDYAQLNQSKDKFAKFALSAKIRNR